MLSLALRNQYLSGFCNLYKWGNNCFCYIWGKNHLMLHRFEEIKPEFEGWTVNTLFQSKNPELCIYILLIL